MEIQDPIDDGVKITINDTNSSGENLVSNKSKKDSEKIGLTIGAIIFPGLAIISTFSNLFIRLDFVSIWIVGIVLSIILTISLDTRSFGKGLLLGLLAAPFIFFGMCLGLYSLSS